MSRLEVWAPDGVPEVAVGDDLAGLVLTALGGGADLADGDVVSVTSKVVSKAEGRTRSGDRDAVRATAAPVVGLSPIVGASHVHGMAAQMLTSIGVEVSAGAVGVHYGARSAGGVLDGWLVDSRDADQLPRLEEAGVRARAVPLMMSDLDATAAMAAAAVALVTGGAA